jgi:hypothetical protein
LSDHSGDELFAKFYAALDEMNFFKTSPAGAEDPGQLSKATQYFTEALQLLHYFLLILIALILTIYPPINYILIFLVLLHLRKSVMSYFSRHSFDEVWICCLSLFRRCRIQEGKRQA